MSEQKQPFEDRFEQFLKEFGYQALGNKGAEKLTT